MNAKNFGLLLLLTVLFASTGLAQDAAMIRYEYESPDGNGSFALPLSIARTDISAMLEQSAKLEQTLVSSCDEIRALARELSGKDSLTLDTKHDSVAISVRKEDGIVEFKVADADTTIRFKQPAEVFEAMLSSNSDCKLPDLSILLDLEESFLIVGEARTSKKLQLRFRLWIERDGQKPPPWL